MTHGNSGLNRQLPAWISDHEIWWTWLVGAMAFLSVPLTLGHIGLGWDALNHHVYLGWIAQSPRFDQDLFAAAYQSYQYPYLYWPVYALATSGASGVVAGCALAILQSLAIPPVWIVARHCCPGTSWSDGLLRLAGVVLAFGGGVTLSLLDSTSNDLIACVPLLWAIALGMTALEAPSPYRLVVWSGLLAGLSVAFKLSNGPLVLVMPFLWGACGRGTRARCICVLAGSLATVAGFVLSYGWWGWQLWRYFGNPIYPFYDTSFEAVRMLLGWHR